MKTIPLNQIGLLKEQYPPSANHKADHSLPVARYSSLIPSLYGLLMTIKKELSEASKNVFIY